ncbi:MAG: hypothetical protein IJP29_07390 [Lachnospiraceae bacterium]|nr:hypothetical protein [Lachnospiraceae bacterium]
MLNNSFYEMTVKSKPTKSYDAKMFVGIVLISLGVALVPMFGILTLLISVLGVFIANTFVHDNKVEYEYTLTEGNIEVAAIYNLSKRKELLSFSMDRVAMIVPKGSLRIDNLDFKKKQDYTSKKKDARVYCFVVDYNTDKHLIMLEPDDIALEHIRTHAKHKMYED